MCKHLGWDANLALFFCPTPFHYGEPDSYSKTHSIFQFYNNQQPENFLNRRIFYGIA